MSSSHNGKHQTAPLQTAPFSQEAEEATLGACLTNPNMFFVVASLLTAEDFFLLRHQWIWEAIGRIVAHGDGYDYLTVAEELRATGHLEQVGGVSYLLQLVNNTPSSSMGETYAKLVARAATRRRMLTAAEEIKDLVLDESLSLEQVTIATEKAMLTAIGQGQATRTVKLEQSVGRVLEDVEALLNKEREFTGIPTGFHALDKLLMGLDKGKLYMVAGRPGMGKSALMLNTAVHLAKQKKRVFYWSGEMEDEENTRRVLSAEAAIPSNRIKAGKITIEEWERLVEATRRMLELPLWFDCTPGLNPTQLRAMLTRQAMQHGVDLCVVDYVQLMRYPGFAQNPVQELSEISRALKELSLEFNIPILAGAQLNRDVEERPVKIPHLSDLRGSGSLEQDSDVVMFIYRDEVYNEMTERPNEADIIVAKHRGGPTGTIPLFWEGALTRFLNGRINTIDLKGHTS